MPLSSRPKNRFLSLFPGADVFKNIKLYNIFVLILVFVLVPVFFYSAGDFPRRSLMKEAISIMTVLAFSIMMVQFFLARTNRSFIELYKMKPMLSVHKFIGYGAMIFFMVHPLLIVVPRAMEGGIAPFDALITILTHFENTGVLLGILAWILMLVLGITSFFRFHLGIEYPFWRWFHGVLGAVFMIAAAWHAIALGRHVNLMASIFVLAIVASGLTLLLVKYSAELMNKKA